MSLKRTFDEMVEDDDVESTVALPTYSNILDRIVPLTFKDDADFKAMDAWVQDGNLTTMSRLFNKLPLAGKVQMGISCFLYHGRLPPDFGSMGYKPINANMSTHVCLDDDESYWVRLLNRHPNALLARCNLSWLGAFTAVNRSIVVGRNDGHGNLVALQRLGDLWFRLGYPMIRTDAGESILDAIVTYDQDDTWPRVFEFTNNIHLAKLILHQKPCRFTEIGKAIVSFCLYEAHDFNDTYINELIDSLAARGMLRKAFPTSDSIFAKACRYNSWVFQITSDITNHQGMIEEMWGFYVLVTAIKSTGHYDMDELQEGCQRAVDQVNSVLKLASSPMRFKRFDPILTMDFGLRGAWIQRCVMLD